MAEPTPAQEEFQSVLAKNLEGTSKVHPEDRHDDDDDDNATAATATSCNSDLDEEDRHRASQIDAAMRLSSNHGEEFQLPPPSFDNGCATGVKGVIADARSYENARRSKSKWKDRVRAARRSVFSFDGFNNGVKAGLDRSESDGSFGDDQDEETFLAQWRESRRRELEAEDSKMVVRNRRTSPSLRMFGKLDEVDALGYLDAIEKVTRETVVCVFVYDHECQVSATVEDALRPLVISYPNVHFVKVHYEDIEFDNAAVPAILGYRNQGDLFANLTGLINSIPDNEDFDTKALKKLFQKEGII